MYCLLREWEFSLFYFPYEFFKKPNALGLLCPADGQSPHKQSISLYLSLCFSLHLCCLFHSSESSLNGSGPRILAQCTCAIIFVVKTKIRRIFSTSRKWISMESFILKGVPLIRCAAGIHALRYEYKYVQINTSNPYSVWLCVWFYG